MMKDPAYDDMVDFLRKEFPGESEEDFELASEEAIYWFASDWYGGQWSNLYSALSTSQYHPGMMADGVTEGTMAEEMYLAMEYEFSVNKPDPS